MDMKQLENAIKAIKDLGLKRVDGEGYSVYRAGKVIRIDIKEE
jgi:hypothetical protein